MNIVAEADMMEEILSGIEEAVYDIVLVFDDEEDRLRITTADSAAVQMIDLKVPSSSFVVFDPEVGEHDGFREDEDREALFIGMNIEKLYSMISEMDGEISFGIEDNKLVLNDGRNNFAVSSLSIDADEDIPEFAPEKMELETGFTMKISDLKSAVKKAGLLSDEAFFSIEPEESVLKVHTDTGTDSIEAEFDIDSVEGEAVESRFPLSYISDVQKYLDNLSTIDSSVDVKIGDKKPVMFEADTDRENLKTIVAPRLGSKF